MEKAQSGIQTTLGALAEAEPALKRLASIPLSAKTGYHLAKLIRLVDQETKHFWEKRNALITELGEARDATPAEKAAGERGRPLEIRMSSKNYPDFEKRMKELAAVEVSLDWSPLGLSALEGKELSAADVLALTGLLVDDTA